MTLITQSTWPTLRGYTVSIAENSSSSDDVRYSFWLVIPFNRAHAKIERVDLDIFDTPDTIDSLVNGTYSYQGHTWNDLLHCKAEGTVTNVFPSEVSRLYSSWEPANVNFLTGSKTYAYQFIGGSHWFHGHYYSRSWGYRRVTHYQVMLFDQAPDSGLTYQIWANWMVADTDNGPQMLSPYGEELGPVVWHRYSLGDLYGFEKGTSRVWQSSLGYLRDVNGDLKRSQRVPISVFDTEETVGSKLREELLSDMVWRRSQPTFGVRYYNADPRYTLSGSNVVPRFTKPNYEALFPSKERNPNWHEVAAEAYQSLGMADVNGVANISELIGMGSQVRSFAETLKRIPHSAVKHTASAWLAIHYGFKLTLLDICEVSAVLEKYARKRSSLSKCQSVKSFSTGSVQYTARYQVFYDEWANVDSLLHQLLSLTDAYLTTENLWDLTPWSFVVDWFVRIGDVLQSLDNYANLMQKHDVICCGQSIKGKGIRPASIIGVTDGVSSPITLSYYRRAYRKNLITPSLVPSVTVNPFNHLIEGAALYISIK